MDISSDLSLREFFETNYRPLKLRHGSPSTVRLYGCTIRAFGKWLSQQAGDEKGYLEPLLTHLDDMTVSRYLTDRSAKRSRFTSEKERTQILSIWRHACDRGAHPTGVRPSIPPTPLPERIPRAWSVEDLQKIVTAAKAMPGDVEGVPARIFWPALVLLCYQSAERIGAVMSLEKSDYSRPRVFMRAEYRKGGKRDRVYKLSEGLCDLLDILAKANGRKRRLFVWGGPTTYLWDKFGAVVRAAGLPCGRRDKFHKLRRSAATHYAALGHDATALLDHSSPRVTKRYYLDETMISRGPEPSEVLPSIE